jgi:hypothetical protein
MDLMIQTFSGELFTSFKNTLILSILLFGFVIHYFKKTPESEINMDDFVHKFGKASGFTLEGECFKGEEECKAVDFLKGWWVPNGGSYEFMPLVSRLMSYGKTQTNFVHTTPGRQNMERSARYAAYATARCNVVVPRNYPVLGRYLAMCDRVSLPWDFATKAKMFDSIYREPDSLPMFGGSESVKVPADVVLDMMRTRYGEEIIANLPTLDAFLDDIDFDTFEGFTVVSGFPWLSILRDRDYGKPKQVDSADGSLSTRPSSALKDISLKTSDSDSEEVVLNEDSEEENDFILNDSELTPGQFLERKYGIVDSANSSDEESSDLEHTYESDLF